MKNMNYVVLYDEILMVVFCKKYLFSLVMCCVHNIKLLNILKVKISYKQQLYISSWFIKKQVCWVYIYMCICSLLQWYSVSSTALEDHWSISPITKHEYLYGCKIALLNACNTPKEKFCFSRCLKLLCPFLYIEMFLNDVQYPVAWWYKALLFNSFVYSTCEL